MTLAETFKPAERLASARLSDAYEAWNRARGARFAPRREDMTPALLRGCLPWTWFVDVIDGGADFRFRLAGDRVVQFMGRRFAGEVMSAHLDEPFFARMQAFLRECLRRRGPVALGPMRSLRHGKEHLEIEVVAMPLSDDGAAVTTMFGALEVSAVGGAS
ncbi:MAG TPA: PAS domain-containing protein [Rhizomicrobium sp.]|nr:PAS domain-containing protein [Rhizomicrobium sp.]